MKKLMKMVLYGGLVSLCALVFSQNVYSQEQETSSETDISPKFGIKGGVNLTNMYVSDVEDENMKVGAHGGFFAKIPLVRGLSIQPELLYSGKGSKVTYNNALYGRGEYRFNLHYIETPLSLVINLARNFNIHGGAYAAYLAGVNITDMEKDGTINDIRTLNADNFNRFDYGLLGGLAVDIQNFTIGARYNYGLREIGKSGSLSGNLTRNSKNSALAFYVGLGF
jgi:hypothetical protein